jgi:hypothetical protein
LDGGSKGTATIRDGSLSKKKLEAVTYQKCVRAVRFEITATVFVVSATTGHGRALVMRVDDDGNYTINKGTEDVVREENHSA